MFERELWNPWDFGIVENESRCSNSSRANCRSWLPKGYSLNPAQDPTTFLIAFLTIWPLKYHLWHSSSSLGVNSKLDAWDRGNLQRCSSDSPDVSSSVVVTSSGDSVVPEQADVGASTQTSTDEATENEHTNTAETDGLSNLFFFLINPYMFVFTGHFSYCKYCR